MKIPFAGVVHGQEEAWSVMRAFDSMWHGPGPESDAFEKEFAEYIGVKYALLTNSGSSANLLALKSLNLPVGSKVLTSGCGFPATLNPILHLGLQPVLVDYDLNTQNIDVEQIYDKCLASAVSSRPFDTIRAIILAHTMGNPVNMFLVRAAAKLCGAVIIEDCCEALGSKLSGQHVGTFGDIGTFSFYPSHQMNGLGGGGCIVTNDQSIALEARSLRNWGKKVEIPGFAGDHVTAYENKIDDIPYDTAYTYTTVGYNMQPTDVQAAYLREQLRRLPSFVERRKENWEYLRDNIKIPEIKTMEVLEGAEPSYFGYSMNFTGQLEGERDVFASYLERNGVRGRPFFAGNVTRHVPYRHLFQEFPVADHLMKNAMFTGVWPGLSLEHMRYVAERINTFKHGDEFIAYYDGEE